MVIFNSSFINDGELLQVTDGLRFRVMPVERNSPDTMNGPDPAGSVPVPFYNLNIDLSRELYEP